MLPQSLPRLPQPPALAQSRYFSVVVGSDNGCGGWQWLAVVVRHIDHLSGAISWLWRHVLRTNNRRHQWDFLGFPLHCHHQRTSRSIDNVVMGSGRMIDRITATARGAAF
jgi:hypothetical protein